MITVESLLASASFDPSGLTRGLETVTRALEQYDRQAAALTARPATLSVETEPVERSLERLGSALPQLQRQLESLSDTRLELRGAEELTQTTDRVAAGLRDLAAAVPTLALPGVDPAPLVAAVDVGLGALAALDRRVRAIQGTPLSLETDELREQVAGVEAVVGTLLTRLRSLTADPPTLGLDTRPLATALTQVDGLLAGFRARAERELALPAPTIGAGESRAAFADILEAATEASQRIAALQTALPAPDTAATEQALREVVASLTTVQQGIASLNGARVRIDPGNLLGLFTDGRAEVERFLQALTGIAPALDRLTGQTIPLRLEVGDLPAQIAAVQAQLAAVRPVSVPVGFDRAPLATALADLNRELQQLPDGVAVPVTLATPDLRAAVERVQAALDGLQGTTLPVGLDVAGLDTALQSVRTRLREIPPTVTARADLDTAGFTRGLDDIARGLDRVTQQADAFSGRPVALRVDAGDTEAVLARPLALLDRFADAVREVREALPGLRLDPAALTPGLTALDAFLAAADRLATVEFPRLSTREQVAEITTLEQALGRIGPTIAGLDASGVLRNVAAQVRQAVGTLRTDLSQQIILDVDTTPFEAGLAAGEAALNGFRARVAAPLPIALEQTGDLTRQLVALEQGVTQAVTEAVRLMTLPVDQLEARLRGLSSLPLGLDIRSFLSQVAQGEAGVQQFIAAIREGAVDELTRLGASAAQVAAVLRGFEALPSVAVDTTPAVASLRVAEDAADSLIAKLGLVRREAASPVALVTAPAPAPPPDLTGILSAQLQQSEQEAARLIGTLDEVAAGMSRAADGTQVWEESLRRLQTQQEEAAATAEHLASANERLLAGMSQSGQVAEEGSRGAQAWARGLQVLSGDADGVTRSFAAGEVGGSRLIHTLGNIAVSATGLSGPFATVSSNLLTFVASSARLVGVGAVALGIKASYDFLNTAQREVREENERLVQGLLQQANQALPAAERAQRNLTAALQQEADARRNLSRLRGLEVVAPTVVQPFIGEFARREAVEVTDAARAVRLARQQAAEAGLGALLRHTQLTAQLIQLGQADADQRRRALGFVRELEAAESRTNVLSEKLAIRERILETQRALNLAVQQENAARAFTEQRFAQRAQDLAAAPALGTETSASIRERQTEMARLTAVIQSQTASLAERNAAAQRFRELVIAPLAPLQEQLDLLQTQRQARIGVDTTDAVRQLAELERRLQAVGTATAGQRAQVIRLRAEIDLETVEQQIAPLREALQAAVSLRGLRDAGQVKLADALGLAEAEAGISRLRGSVDRLLTTATGPQREVLLQVRTQLAQADQAELQRQVERIVAAAEATVQIQVDPDPALAAIRQAFAQPFGIELDPSNALAQARTLAAELARQIQAATGGGAITDAPAALQQQFARVTEQIQALMDAPVTALIQGADRVTQQLDAALAAAESRRALLAGAGDLGPGVEEILAQTRSVAPLVAEIEAAYVRVTAQIDAGVASTAQLVELQRTQADLADRLTRAHADERTPFEVAQLAPLEQATRAFVEARNRLALAEATGSRAAVQAAQTQVDAAGALMDAISSRIATLAQTLGLDAETTRRLVEGITRAYEQTGRAARAMSADTRAAINAFDGIGQIAGALGQAGRQLGIFGDEGERVFRNLQSLASDTASLIASIAAGDVLGSIAGGINVLGSLGGLFGGGESEADRALRENTIAIRENTIRRTEGFTGIGGAGAAADAINAVLSTQLGRLLAATTQGSPVSRDSRAELVGLLEQQGLSFQQLQRVADEFGITILAKGKLVGEALGQLAEEINASIEAQLKFRSTLDEQLQRLDFRAAFTGADEGLDPFERQRAQFQRELDALIGVIGDSGSFITQQLEGLDLGDPAAIRAAFLRILEQFDAGQLTAEDLGGLTREDLFRLFGDAAGFLDELGRSAGDAAERLGALNVPTVLRLDALRAQASLPEPTLRAFDQPLVNLQTLNDRASETFGIREQSQSFDALADRLGDIAPLERFLQQIATETPDDLLDALRDLSATIGDRAPPEGATQFIRETVERRPEQDRQPAVVIHYHGDPKFYITAQPGQSPQEIAEAVVRVMQDHAMADFGDLTRSGDALGGI